MIQDGIEVDVPGYNGATALLMAVSKQNLGLTAALVSTGADPLCESAEPLDSDCEEGDAAETTNYITAMHLAANNAQVRAPRTSNSIIS